MKDRKIELLSSLPRIKNWICSFLNSKRFNIVLFLMVNELLIILGHDQDLMAQFFGYQYLQEARAKKMGLRIKQEYNDNEIFQMVIYYLGEKNESTYKKCSSDLIDSLFMMRSQLRKMVFLEHEKSMLRIVQEYNSFEDYLYKKGRNFSLYFKNYQLLLSCYSFLKLVNSIDLSEFFLEAAQNDFFLYLKDLKKREILNLNVNDLIGGDRLLRSLGVNSLLQKHLRSFLLLKKSMDTLESILLFIFLCKLCANPDTLPLLLELGDFMCSKNQTDLINSKLQKEILDYVVKTCEAGYIGSFLRMNSQFQECLEEYFESGVDKFVGLEKYYSKAFPTNNIGNFCNIFNKKMEEEYFEDYLYNLLKKQTNTSLNISKFRNQDLKDPTKIQKMAQDFKTATFDLRTDFLNQQSPDFSRQGSPKISSQKKAYNFNNLLSHKIESISENMINHFEIEVNKHNSIRILDEQDVSIDGYDEVHKKDKVPSLAYERIGIFGGYFVTNFQTTTIFKVYINKEAHLRTFMENIEFMAIYSPLFINFIG